MVKFGNKITAILVTFALLFQFVTAAGFSVSRANDDISEFVTVSNRPQVIVVTEPAKNSQITLAENKSANSCLAQKVENGILQGQNGINLNQPADCLVPGGLLVKEPARLAVNISVKPLLSKNPKLAVAKAAVFSKDDLRSSHSQEPLAIPIIPIAGALSGLFLAFSVIEKRKDRLALSLNKKLSLNFHSLGIMRC